MYCSQLVHDGLQEVALSLSTSIGRSANLPAPSGPLFLLVARALQSNEAKEQDDYEQEDDAEQEEEESEFLKYPLQFTLSTFPV